MHIHKRISDKAKKTSTFGAVFGLLVAAVAVVGINVAQGGSTQEVPPPETTTATEPVVACTDDVCALNGEPSMMACATAADCDVGTVCAMDATDSNLTACHGPVSEQASVTAPIAQLHRLDTTCPPPTVKNKGGKCVLTRDVTLTEVLVLASFTHLNCRGFKIIPSGGGSFGTNPNGSSTVTNSKPRAAFVLNEAHGTRIQNCIIGEDGNRFDFGIIAVKNKIPSDLVDNPGAINLRGNKILKNSITTVRSAVTILGSDNNVIAGNTLRIIAAAPAINILRDSDSNRVRHNHITVDGHGAPQILNSDVAPPDLLDEETVPGHFVGSRSASLANHIRIAIGRTTNNELINFRLGDQLLQFPLTKNSVTGNANEQPADNIIDGNTLDRNKVTYGTLPNIFEDGGSSTIFRNNTVGKGWMGMAFDGEITSLATYPGKCTLDPDRYCRFASDCTTLQPNPPGGTCQGVLSKQTIDESSENLIVENNIMTGPYTSPAAPQGLYIVNTKNIRVVGNTVRFNGVPNGPNDPGVTILELGAESAILSRNIITGNSIGLRLFKFEDRVGPSMFGSKVSLNDFVGNTKIKWMTEERTVLHLMHSPLPQNYQSTVRATIGVAPALTAKASTTPTS